MTSNPQTGPVYRKLPGSAKRMFGFFVNEAQRIWLAHDHILIVTQSYYNERYKRFYLADIQALSIRKTSAGAALNFILLCIAAIFVALGVTGYIASWEPAALVTLGIIAGVFSIAAIINVAFGPTCQCQVLTAVHEETLYCLGRYRTAQRVVEELRAIIEGVQGMTTGNEREPTAQPMQAASPAMESGGSGRA